jgi:hypothetical protein
MEHETRRTPSIAPVLVVIGGALVIVSYFFKWGRVVQPHGAFNSYLKGDPLVILTGAAGMLIGILLWAISSRGARIGLSIVAILAGIFAVLFGVAALSKPIVRNQIADKTADAVNPPVSHDRAQKAFKQLEERGVLETSVGAAGFFAVPGGVLIVIGGIVGLVMASRAEPAVPSDEAAAPYGAPPPPPPADGEQMAQPTGWGSAGRVSEPVPPPPPAQPTPSAPSEPEPPPPPSETETPEQG